MSEVVLTIACQESVLVVNRADTHHTCSTQKSKTLLQSPLLHTHPSTSAAIFAKMTIMIATPSFLHPNAVRKKCNPEWLFSYKKTPEPYFHVTVRLCTFCNLLFFLLSVCKFTKVSARIESNVIEDTSHKLKKMHFPSQSKFDSRPN